MYDTDMKTEFIIVPKLDDGIPERVTRKEFRDALDEYAAADKVWSDFVNMKYLAQKENAGDHLYRLCRALLKNNGFYNRDAVIDSRDGKNGPLPNPDDFD